MKQTNFTQEQKPEIDEVEGGLIEIDPSSETSEGIEELESEIESTAESFNVTSHKCTKCGLVHNHNTDKHRASDTFSMNHKEAGQMEFNSVCHCGVHSLAAGRGPDSVDKQKAREIAGDAPVPESVQRQLR